MTSSGPYSAGIISPLGPIVCVVCPGRTTTGFFDPAVDFRIQTVVDVFAGIPLGALGGRMSVLRNNVLLNIEPLMDPLG